MLLNKCQRHSEFCNPFTGFVQGVTALHCSVLYLLCRYFFLISRDSFDFKDIFQAIGGTEEETEHFAERPAGHQGLD